MRLSLALPLISTFSYGFRGGLAASANGSAFVVSHNGKQETLSFVNNNSVGKTARKMTTTGSRESGSPVDPEFPGTAVERMLNIRERVKELTQGDDLNQKWDDVRRRILWAGGLKDLPNAAPGQGYTGHAFNDFNHVDCTAMLPVDSQNNGEIEGIARGNFLGEGIRIASLPELGPGGSWSTCALGCNKDPPQDVAHVRNAIRLSDCALSSLLFLFCSNVSP